ncbi:uncharacterized protein [Aegilops tauschii subsp. strangulata]|uniref:uncharacterized protein n=1 Tax=Aegilops tauschii subsp. strangulata TaxID=200361 RepID=UPI00098B3ECF|nr:uncharacterized protein LOC109743803 [Aegilops tauschii subsp. strangulata]
MPSHLGVQKEEQLGRLQLRHRSALANLAAAGYMFQPTGRELVGHYLIPRAGLGGFFLPGVIEEGVDVLSLRPRALSFPENHKRDYSEVWGFFFTAKLAGETCPTPGAGRCWVQYGQEKAYYGGEGGREEVAFRHRFAYRYTWRDGEVMSQTRWRMKEYRLNRNAAAFRRAHPSAVPADVVFVVHKVYRKPLIPRSPPPPVDSSSSKDEGFESYILYPRLDELMRRLTEGN